MYELLAHDTLSLFSWWDDQEAEQQQQVGEEEGRKRLRTSSSSSSTLAEPAKRRKMSEERSNNENQGDINSPPLYQLEEVDVVESEGVLPSGGAADVSMPRHDHPHQPHHHSPHEDELDLERELEILLQSPMLYSPQDLALVTGAPGLPPDPQFGDVSLATLTSHGTAPVPTSIDELINTIFEDHHRPPPPHLPLLLPAPAPLSTTNPLSMSTSSAAAQVDLPAAATVTLTHKPRGSHGVWLPLNDSQRIRYANPPPLTPAVKIITRTR
jgi:hypothetical protein